MAQKKLTAVKFATIDSLVQQYQGLKSDYSKLSAITDEAYNTAKKGVPIAESMVKNMDDFKDNLFEVNEKLKELGLKIDSQPQLKEAYDWYKRNYGQVVNELRLLKSFTN